LVDALVSDAHRLLGHLPEQELGPRAVERTIAWLTRGNRRLRYRGVVKNDHWLHHRAAALNLRRLINLGLADDGTAWALA
jgi:hypothetical protein